MVDWGDVPTWVTAGVALLALVAAVRAYQDQSAGLKKQAEAVEMQRQQLEAQTRLQEREQADPVDVQVRAYDGAQATVLPRDKGEQVHMVVVINNSNRPIRFVVPKVEPGDGNWKGTQGAKIADVLGEMTPIGVGSARVDAFEFKARTGVMPLLRAGHKAAFAWGLTVLARPSIRSCVRFTDDAGLVWEVDSFLHLQKLSSRDW